MEIFNLVGKLGLTGADQVNSELEKTKSTLEKTQHALRMTGIAFTALGAAGLKMVSDARKMNAELGQTALTLGISTKEMRNLALETTDVTFPLSSVTKTFELLARAGVTSTEEMKKSAKAFDALADATGSSAEVMADLLLPAFKLFGEDIPTTSAELDKFTWMTKNTLVDLSDFGTLLTRMAPYMDTLDMSMDDAIATLAALGERGITGTAATLKLRTAITQAASSGEDLNTILGISQEEIDGFKKQMSDATGITDKYAEVANTQYGVMAKVKQKFSELTLVAGSFLTPLEPVLTAMTALGPVMLFFSTATGIATVKTVAHTAALIAHKVVMFAGIIATKAAAAAQWLWNAAMSANPIGLIILAIAALVVGIILMIKHWDKDKEVFGKVWDWIMDKFKAVVNFFKEAFEKVTGFILAPISIIKEAWEELTNWIKTVPSKIAGFFTGIKDKIGGHFSGLKDRVGKHFEETNEKVRNLLGRLKDEMSERAADMQRRYEEAGGGIKGKFVANMGAMRDDVKGILEKMGFDTDDIGGKIKGIWDNIIDFFKSVPSKIGAAFSTLKDIMLAPFRFALRGIEMAINWLIRQINKIHITIPSWVPGIGGKGFGFDIPEISLPSFQKGGLITEPTLLYGLRSKRPYAIAGEAGIETVTPGEAGINNYFNISSLVVREEADIRYIARELYRLQLSRSRAGG